MAAPLLFDLSELEASALLYDKAQIYTLLPQSEEFALLDGVVRLDRKSGEAVAFMDVSDKQWWCKAHIPGHPILPGVLMLEAAAHVAALMERYSIPGFEGFIGFGGVDDCKFRRTVEPPARFWYFCRRIEARSRRIVCDLQGVVDGTLVFEAKITGLVIAI